MSFLANVVIEPDLCNLRCNYCWIGEQEVVSRRGTNLVTRYQNSLRESINRPLTDLLDNFESLLQTISTTVLKLSGGEIFLVPELINIAARMAHRFVRIQLLTNGTLLNEYSLKNLDPSIFSFQLSLDGHTESSNRERFGRRSMSLTRSVLHSLNRLTAAGFNVEINCVLTPTNIGEFLPFVHYLASIHPGVTVFPFPARFTDPIYRLSKPSHLSILDDVVKECVRLNGTLPPLAYCEALRWAVEHGKNVKCYLPTFIQSSDELGNLSFCPCGTLAKLGNLFEDTGLLRCPHLADTHVQAVLNWEYEKCRRCFTHFDLLNLYFVGRITEREMRNCGMFQNKAIFDALEQERRRVTHG